LSGGTGPGGAGFDGDDHGRDSDADWLESRRRTAAWTQSQEIEVEDEGAAARQNDAATKRLTLVACILGSGIVFVDGSIVNVALPALRADLGGGLAGQQWTVNAYLVTLSALLLVGGSLGDLYGERRVFSLGVLGFGLVSIICAVAPTIEVLILGRALQGVFGALLVPATLAVIAAVFPPEERGAAIGAWTAWTGVAAVVGPLAGGVLIDAASWRFIFAVNIPLVLATLALVARYVPEVAHRRPGARVDVVGAGMCALGLAGPTYALIEQPVRGWADPVVSIPLVAGLAFFLAFLVYESRARFPMLPLGLFARRNFAVANLECLLMYGGLNVLLVFLVLFLQQVGGFSALEAGLALMPVTVVMFLLSRRFGALADRLGPRLFMGLGPLVAGTGLLLFIRLDADVSYVTELLPAAVLFSLGLAMTVAPLTATVLADADEENAGVASGVNNAISRVAGLLGIAAVGAVIAAQYATTLDARLADRPLGPEARAVTARAKDAPLAPVEAAGLGRAEGVAVTAAADEASTQAFRVGLGVAGVLVMLGGVIGTLGIRNPRRAIPAESCPGGALCGATEHAAPEIVRPARRPAPVARSA
jgi:EmrB/QacA subfamily drug resistance transporter